MKLDPVEEAEQAVELLYGIIREDPAALQPSPSAGNCLVDVFRCLGDLVDEVRRLRADE